MIPSLPPVAGTVVRYGYLWKRHAEERRVEGEKDRPAALIVARAPGEGECIVLAITHAPPHEPGAAVEIPAAERARLGLDDQRSWIVLTEFNAFLWPGPDLRPIPEREPSTVVYGKLSRAFFADVLARVQQRVRARRTAPVRRT